jgi:hypothetical protein
MTDTPAPTAGRPRVGGYRDARRIVVAGDWHGNAEWAEHVIRMSADALSGEGPRIILQLGDFGVWPGPAGAEYLHRVSGTLEAADCHLWFVDGNHEAFPILHDRAEQERRFLLDSCGSTEISPRVSWLQRGQRWMWHGRMWLALGGAVSLDRAIRTEGADWWAEEEITAEQAASAMADGPAQVMVTHDCPSGVVHTFPPPPRFWDLADLARNDAHRERLQEVVSAVRPGWLLHGHLHRAYQRACDLGYGPVQVTGLDCDDGDGPNWAVLDVKRMAWTKT